MMPLKISTGIHEMDRLTQDNAAVSEEAASSATEMHHESQQLNAIVNQLVQVMGGHGEATPKATRPGQQLLQ